jgi:hypothetical protein
VLIREEIDQQRVLAEEKEEEEGEKPHHHEDSCGVADHVNEDDENLNTSTLKEEDQRCILIIGGINIFLTRIPAEASAYVAYEKEMQEAFEEEAIGPIFLKLIVYVKL